MRRWDTLTTTVAAVAASILIASAAHADPVKCKAAIAKNGQAFALAKMKTLQKCEAAVLAGKLPANTNCHTELKAAPAIAKAATKLHTAIATACGGDDKTCGTPDGDDAIASLGWPSTCPNLENGTCANAINDCEGIATCIECVEEAAVDQLNALYHDASVAHLQAAGSAEQKCQVALGKTAAAFFAAERKALGKCWAAVDKAAATAPCPVPGDGKAQLAIDKAQAKAFAGGCKACGGGGDSDANGACDTAPFAPGTIGAPPSCPGFQVPGGQNCGTIGAITSLEKLLLCEACVTEFKVDCITPLTVPHDAAYPSQCNAPVCGNGHIENGETCDDGNAVNGDACPANCVIAPCTPTATTRNVTVTFAGAPAASVVVYLEYPEGKVSLPGTGSDQSVQDRFSGAPTNALVQANDLDYATNVGVVKTSNFNPGQLFIAQFDTCSGAPVPTNAEFPCTVTDASDSNGTNLTGLTCSATVN